MTIMIIAFIGASIIPVAMQAYDPNHQIHGAVISFIQSVRLDERLQSGSSLSPRDRKKVIGEIADEVAKARKVDADELIKMTGCLLAS